MRRLLLTAFFALLIVSVQAPNVPSIFQLDGEYEEKLVIQLVGRTAFARISLNGGNITLPGLQDVEKSLVSIVEYRIYASKISSRSPEFELFTKAGFGQVDSKLAPSEGVFLELNGATSDDAFKAAQSFNRLLKLAFVEYSRSGDTSIFYSHAKFDELITKRLWHGIPTSLGGLANLISTESLLEQDFFQFVFMGRLSGGGYNHSIELAFIRKNAVVENRFRFTSFFNIQGKPNSSSFARSSSIRYDVNGGLIAFGEGGRVENSLSALKASLTNDTIGAGKRLPLMNMTLVQSFPSLIVTRSFDKGSYSRGETVSVGIRIRNVAPLDSPLAQNVTIKDDWWLQHPDAFDFVFGNYSSRFGLKAGENATLAYTLRVKTDKAGGIKAPVTMVPYHFAVGKSLFELAARSNTFNLYLNHAAPSLKIEADTDETSIRTGAALDVALTITNIGNLPAIALRIEDQSRQSLLPNDKWIVKVRVASQLTQPNQTSMWMVRWFNQLGEPVLGESNSVSLYHSFTSPHVPSLRITKTAKTFALSGKEMVNVTLKIRNLGSANATEISLSDNLPRGLSYVSGDFKAANDTVVSRIELLNAFGEKTMNYTLSIDRKENYALLPLLAESKYAGSVFATLSTSAALPLGVRVVKEITPTVGFIPSTFHAFVEIRNDGVLPIFDIFVNATDIKSIVKEFGNTTISRGSLLDGESTSAKYDARFARAGLPRIEPARASFIFAGENHLINSSAPAVKVFETPVVQTKISGRLVENQVFELKIIVTNPSNVTITNVTVETVVPQQLEIVTGLLEIDDATLSGGDTVVKEARLLVRKPGAVTITPPKLKFKYLGEEIQGSSNMIRLIIEDDVQNRYVLPSAIAIALLSFTALTAKIASKPSPLVK